ncbi:MAG: hydrolase 2, exosortase A system-associated [Halieaceae bacterium]|nr:hydrolase 2, exosortase A system-associated [Halieaceae bacterium]
MTLPDASIEQHFCFIPGARGQLFAALRHPGPDRTCISALLCVMPLAEEMNRCRRLVALQARVLAAAGIAVLCVDPYGCGDSEGEFADADWNTWLDDLRVARDWLGTRTGLTVDVWAIRHGALLAADAFRAALPQRILLWQPVVSGSAALREMLRVSVASGMLSGGDRPRGVDALREALFAGETIDVGGYPITPDLARALDAASLDPWPFGASRVAWIEVSGSAPEPNGQPAPSTAERFRVPGAQIDERVLTGRRFWSAPDVFEFDQLIGETLQVVGEVPCQP